MPPLQLLSYLHLLHHLVISASAQPITSPSLTCPFPSGGFDYEAAASQAQRLSTHSWEYGTASEALLELYNPDLSVFSPTAFPNCTIPEVRYQDVPALVYAAQHIRVNNETLVDGDGAVGDPASLGVSAILIGQTEPAYVDAARQQYISLNTAPRAPNGAISHRSEDLEIWADFVAMAPPFMAYNAVAENSSAKLKQAVEQCLLYRDVLQVAGEDVKNVSGSWRHIVPYSDDSLRRDLGIWSTGNGWAAMGMARVLAVILHWDGGEGELVGANGTMGTTEGNGTLGTTEGNGTPGTTEGNGTMGMAQELFGAIGKILEAAVRVEKDENGLLRNYWDDETWFGEISGSALITATIYRLAVLQNEAKGVFEEGGLKDVVTPEMIEWADCTCAAVAASVDKDGIARPAVNPLDWKDRTPYTKGSPEGQSFLVLMYSAWRDCQRAGVCQTN